MKFLLPLVVLGLATPLTSQAAVFTNRFVQFQLPSKWKCNLEGAEWVCQSTDGNRKRDAIIILAAKLRGDQDHLQAYEDYLKKAKAYKSVKGAAVRSKPKYTKRLTVNAHEWVDSLHLESEIPGFYTRYLATTKKDIGVLVTYSINMNKYQSYLGDFETLVKTLRVFRKGPINAMPKKSNIFKRTSIPTGLSETTVFPGVTPEGASDDVAATGGQDNTMLYMILGGVGLLGFIIWRRRRGGGE